MASSNLAPVSTSHASAADTGTSSSSSALPAESVVTSSSQQPAAGEGMLLLSEATDQQVCARLCSLMKAQLVKAHAEVMLRYGCGASFTEEDLKESPGEAEDDLESLMHHILSSTRDTLNDRFKTISAAFGSAGEDDPSDEKKAASENPAAVDDDKESNDTAQTMPR